MAKRSVQGRALRCLTAPCEGPDAAWVSYDRWNALSEQEQESHAPLCPEFVIEVRSKSDRLAPLKAKMSMWMANGAQLAWLIDPRRREVTIYRPGESPEVHHDPSSVQGSGPLLPTHPRGTAVYAAGPAIAGDITRISPFGSRSIAPICPDFVIELRSPSDKLADVQAKMKMWILNGAEVAWLIDPERKTIEIYRPGNSKEEWYEPSSVPGTGPVAGFELVMARVWQ